MVNIPTNTDVITALKDVKEVPENLIYLCYRGSISYNTYIPPTKTGSVSDVDLLGVYILPKEYYIGISQHKSINPTTIEVKKEIGGVLYDCVFYELRHFTNMALRCNPNVICSLWVKPNHRLIVNHRFNIYLNINHMFISRRQLFKSFSGYANSSMQSMTHYELNSLGEKRRKLIETYGYDIKNAAQLVYLLTISIEALNTGYLTVYRTKDEDIIKDIKMGKWTLDEVKMFANTLFNTARKAYERSTIQEEPRTDKIEKLIVALLRTYIIKGDILD